MLWLFYLLGRLVGSNPLPPLADQNVLLVDPDKNVARKYDTVVLTLTVRQGGLI